MKNVLGNRRVTSVALIALGGIALVVFPLIAVPFANFQVGMIAAMAVAILGLNIVMGYTGQIALSQSVFLGLGAYVAAWGAKNELNEFLIFALALILPGIVGLLVAIPGARLKGYSFAMLTVALPVIAVPLATRFSDVTGGTMGLSLNWLNAPEWTGLERDQWRYYVVIIIAVVLFLLARNLLRGRIGRAFTMIRDNELVAASMGVPVFRYKVTAFTISAMYGGAAGFMYAGIVQFTSEGTLGLLVSINLLAAMVIGGRASLVGSVIAGVFYVMLPLVVGEIDPTQTSIYSGVILLAVLFLAPGGLVTLPRLIRGWFSKRHHRSTHTPTPSAERITKEK